MLSIQHCRKIDPELEILDDEELLEVIHDMYGFAELAFEDWHIMHGSKFPNGLLQRDK